jgi:hypothetical protein
MTNNEFGVTLKHNFEETELFSSLKKWETHVDSSNMNSSTNIKVWLENQRAVLIEGQKVVFGGKIDRQEKNVTPQQAM